MQRDGSSTILQGRRNDGHKKLEMQDNLDLIEEGSDEEDEEDDYENQNENFYSSYAKRRDDPITFSPSEVAQAFSHFSYRTSGV